MTATSVETRSGGATPATAPSVGGAATPTTTAAAVRLLSLGFAVAVVLLGTIDPAAAQPATGAGVTGFLQNIVTLITGPLGQVLAVLAIAIVGVGALMGAFSVRMLGGVVAGVMILFGASWIVGQITGA